MNHPWHPIADTSEGYHHTIDLLCNDGQVIEAVCLSEEDDDQQCMEIPPCVTHWRFTED
jgi:hypothetical protein